jgi:hypothetical protein
MAPPITKTLDADGNVLHDCKEAGCTVSLDGYVLAPGYLAELPDPVNLGEVTRSPLAQGARVPNAKDPGKRWDVATPGVARLRSPGG